MSSRRPAGGCGPSKTTPSTAESRGVDDSLVLPGKGGRNPLFEVAAVSMTPVSHNPFIVLAAGCGQQGDDARVLWKKLGILCIG
jgi:hypothetical protein